MGVYWNLLKKAIKLTMRNSNGPQKRRVTLIFDDEQDAFSLNTYLVNG